MFFNSVAYASLPQTLKSSDYVDLLLLLVGEKNAVRLGANTFDVYEEMCNWCKQTSYRYIISKSGLMYISRYLWLARIVSIVDNSLLPHEFLLGRLLGYPACCSKKIASLGEQSIDQWESELVEYGHFNGDYSLIDPSGYIEGTSLISHIPCSCNCVKSLKIAKSALRVIKEYSDNESFYRWKKWL